MECNPPPGWNHMSVRQSFPQPAHAAATSARSASRDIAHLLRACCAQELTCGIGGAGKEDADAIAQEARVSGHEALPPAVPGTDEHADEVAQPADEHRHLEDDDEKRGQRDDRLSTD